MSVVAIVIGVLILILVTVIVITFVFYAGGLSRQLTTAANTAARGVETVANQFVNFGAQALQGTVVLAGWIVQTFVRILEQTKDVFANLYSTTSLTFKNLAKQAAQILTGGIQQTQGIFVQSIDFIASFGASIGDAIARLASQAYTKLILGFINVMSDLLEFLERQVIFAFETTQGALVGAANSVVQFFIYIGEQVTLLIQQLQGIWPPIYDFITTVMDPAINAIVDAANDVFDFLLFFFCLYCEFCRINPLCSRPDTCHQFC